MCCLPFHILLCPLTSHLTSITHPNQEDAEVDVSFIGCSWLMIYHIGVSSTLLDAGVIKPGHTVVGGSSSGSLVAAALASGVDLNQLKKLIVDMSLDSHQRILGPLGR